MLNLLKKLYIRTTGYSYTNMGRLFLRMFVGIMMLQFGVRQWMEFSQTVETFSSLSLIGAESAAGLLIFVEIFCSFCIMIGFCTRWMVMPPFVAMLVAECMLLASLPAATSHYMLGWNQPVYLPMMFMGIYFFIMLVGPGKISCDYYLSLHILHADNASETELEEV